MHRRTVLKGLAATVPTLGVNAAQAAPDGFYVPAEDLPHRCTFMQWPSSRRVYFSRRFLEKLQNTITELANTIAKFEPVIMLATGKHHARMRQRLSDNVELWDISTDDLWTRDSGPIFVQNNTGEHAIRHIAFNGWGKKQSDAVDGRIAEQVAKRLGLPLLPTHLKGEAGGIEQDGHGLLMAHESSWVIDNRNPGLSREEVGAALLDAYGADRMIWAPGLIGQDITDYHIDGLARFTGPGRVLISMSETPYPDDPFYLAAKETLSILRAEGFEPDIIPDPVKRRINDPEFVATYANFYVCNGAVIASEFGDARTDAIARDALARHYPGREIVMLNTDPIGEVGGGIHCATHEMPEPA